MATVEHQELRAAKIKAIVEMLQAMTSKQRLNCLSDHGLLTLRKDLSLALEYIVPGLAVVALFVPSLLSTLAPIAVVLLCITGGKQFLLRPHMILLYLLGSATVFFLARWFVQTGNGTQISYHYLGVIFVVWAGASINGLENKDYAADLVDKGVSPSQLDHYFNR